MERITTSFLLILTLNFLLVRFEIYTIMNEYNGLHKPYSDPYIHHVFYQNSTMPPSWFCLLFCTIQLAQILCRLSPYLVYVSGICKSKDLLMGRLPQMSNMLLVLYYLDSPLVFRSWMKTSGYSYQYSCTRFHQVTIRVGNRSLFFYFILSTNQVYLCSDCSPHLASNK